MTMKFLCNALLVVGLFVSLLWAAAAGTPTTKKTKPNFVVLFMDDLGYGDMGFTGHPTTKTPNLDRLAWNGKILTTWYSGCNVCSGSRTALMTGRQWPRTGMPGVLSPIGKGGLNLNETTLAEQLKKGGYATAAVGKWHLGQRQVYLPGNRGFDYYLGIPYSDDMGDGIQPQCSASKEDEEAEGQAAQAVSKEDSSPWAREAYEQVGMLKANYAGDLEEEWPSNDPAAKFLPLVHQANNQTKVLEQPLNFGALAQKYSDFATDFLEQHKDGPFFLYMPFSHVHVTSRSQPDRQYASCSHQGATLRGSFGDALAESDWIVGNIVQKLEDLGIDKDTLILFTSDNGPWLVETTSGGSEGLFTGRYSGYWDTGKGSNWEGGIREPAFAYWKGAIEPFSRSAEIISSMDVFPTLSKLAGVELPKDRVFDGRDASDILLKEDGKTKHDFLFFYGSCTGMADYHSITAVRHGPYKVHWCTAPGLGQRGRGLEKSYDPPLMFNVEVDPSEAKPLNEPNRYPKDSEDKEALDRILKAYAMEKATFEFGHIIPIPDGPGEGSGKYGVCCDRSKKCNCTTTATASAFEKNVGIFNLGTREHHDKYHLALGEDEPSPPRTRAQMLLQTQRSVQE